MAILNLHSNNVLDQLLRKRKNLEYGFSGEQERPNPLDSYEPASEDLPTVTEDMSAKPPEKDWLARLKEEYKPETRATNRFNRLLDEPPQRNKPSVWRKIVAAGQGAGNIEMKRPGGPDAADRVLQAPYLHDMAEWKEKAEPYSRAAQLENTSNVNERQLLSQGIQAENQADKNRIAQQKVDDQHEIGLIRANAYAAKNNGANVEIDKNTGQIVATWKPGSAQYPKGHVEYLGKVPGSTTAAELANIRGGYQVQAAEKRGEAERGNIKARAGSKLYRDSANNYYTFTPGEGWMPIGDAPEMPVGATQEVGTSSRSSDGSTEPNTKAEVEIERQKRMRAVFNNPDHRKWFTEDAKTGELRMIPKPKKTGYPSYDEDRAHWDRTYAMVNPGFEPAAQNAPPAPPPTLQSRPPTQNGRTVLQGPDGKKFTIPSEQVSAFLQSPQGKGYSVVR